MDPKFLFLVVVTVGLVAIIIKIITQKLGKGPK